MSLKKPKCLTLYEKSLVIQELNDGQGVTYLAKKYGVAKSTICKIKQNKEIISMAVKDTYLGPGNRQTLKCSEFPKMEKELYDWFLDQRNKNVIVSGEMIKKKARLIHSQVRKNNRQFTASEGWLQRFKRRFGIRFQKTAEEKISFRCEPMDQVQLKNKIQELDITLEQLYNADEAGLYWKLLPENTLDSAVEKTAADRKTEKQRITFLACTNATGSHKLKPMVIGKASNPRSFENFDCPVKYEHSSSACMTATIFKKWFHYSFVPEVQMFLKNKGLPIKALLLLDNAPSHPNEDQLKSKDGQIIAMYLPPNVTPVLEPIRLTKLYYRNSLLTNVVKNETNVSDALRNLTLKDAVINLMAAWNHLDPVTIKKGWCLDGVYSKFEDDENASIPECQVDNENSLSESLEQPSSASQGAFEQCDVLEWNQCDIKIENDGFDECQSDEAVEEKPEPLNRISLDRAIDAFNVITQWAEENDVDFNDLIVIKRLREKAIMQNIKKSPRTNKDF